MDTNANIPQRHGTPTYAERLQKLAVDDAYWGGYYKGAWKGLSAGMLLAGTFVLACTFLIKMEREAKKNKKEEHDNA